MIKEFFKGFFTCLVWIIIFIFSLILLRFVVDLVIGAWGLAFGFGFWSFVILAICIVAGWVYIQRRE